MCRKKTKNWAMTDDNLHATYIYNFAVNTVIMKLCKHFCFSTKLLVAECERQYKA